MSLQTCIPQPACLGLSQTSHAFAGNFVRVKKVAAYQYTMTVASSQACNQTLYAAWKNETGFDESVYQGA